jgi:predicted RNA binding protein YcfA (HicA-like mRNA interferase family)
MLKMPSMSSRQLASLLERGGAVLARQRKTDHAIYSRVVEGRRFSAPVQTERKRWILFTARGFYDNSNSLTKRFSNC